MKPVITLDFLLVLVFVLSGITVFQIIPDIDATNISNFSTELTIDNPPRLGETAELTLTFTDRYPDLPSYIKDFYTTIIRLPDGFELVSGQLEDTHPWKEGDSIEISITVRAIQTGNWTIHGIGQDRASDSLSIVVSEDDSYIQPGGFPAITISEIHPDGIVLGPPGSISIDPKIQRSYDLSGLDDVLKRGYPTPTTNYDYSLIQNELYRSAGMISSFDPSSFYIYESPKKQVDSGILPEDVTCRKNKILVILDDGDTACVTKKTADRANWKIIRTEFPQPFSAELTMDNPPKLGETAEVTLAITDVMGNPLGITKFRTIIYLPDGFELVSGKLDDTRYWTKGDPFEVNVTVKAVQTGDWVIYGIGSGSATDKLHIMVSKDGSYIHQRDFSSQSQFTEADP